MGLSQKISFEYSERDDIEKFINEVFQAQNIRKENQLFTITPKESGEFIIELAIEDYGLYIHRSGEYFEMFGILLEQITGKFSKATIEDY